MSPRPIYISHHNEQRNNVGTVQIEITIELDFDRDCDLDKEQPQPGVQTAIDSAPERVLYNHRNPP